MGSIALHNPSDKTTDCDQELVALCDALHTRDPARVRAAREALLRAFGGDERKLVDSVAVASFFNGIADRIADSTCLRLEDNRLGMSTRLAMAGSNVLNSSTSPLVQGTLRPVSLTVAGFADCPFHQKALTAARAMVAQPGADAMELTDMTFATRDEYREWLFGPQGRETISWKPPSMGGGKGPAGHTSSPIVWREGRSFIGGCDALLELKNLLDAATSMAQKQAESAAGDWIVEASPAASMSRL